MAKGTLPPHLLSLFNALGKTIPAGRKEPADESTEWGIVQSITAGPPKSYAVAIGGSLTPTPGLSALDSYNSGSPAQNDRVLLRRMGTDYVILGRVP